LRRYLMRFAGFERTSDTTMVMLAQLLDTRQPLLPTGLATSLP